MVHARLCEFITISSHTKIAVNCDVMVKIWGLATVLPLLLSLSILKEYK